MTTINLTSVKTIGVDEVGGEDIFSATTVDHKVEVTFTLTDSLWGQLAQIIRDRRFDEECRDRGVWDLHNAYPSLAAVVRAAEAENERLRAVLSEISTGHQGGANHRQMAHDALMPLNAIKDTQEETT